MHNETVYTIGAVSKMLGISPHALRKWEDRHRAIHPARSAGGDRRYSRADLDRLSRLKRLVEAGHAISALAPLSDDELEALLAGAATAAGAAGRPVRLAVLGERIADELAQAGDRMPGVEVATAAVALEALPDTDADAIVAEHGSLGADTAKDLARIRARTGVDRIILVYGYGSIESAQRLSDATTALVRRPVNHFEFARTAAALIGHSMSALPVLGLPPHRFSRDVLAAMATISPELACECPRHVGQLLIELSDFEQYSADCENTKPDDAVIHNMLRRTAATSRALFEDALVQLAEAEGIDLNDAQPDPRVLGV